MQRNTRTASWEIYSGLRARVPLIVRADGRGFKKILENCKKPHDPAVASSFAEAAACFFKSSGLSPALAFTFSDEISLLFTVAPFSGRVEKIDSTIAGFLSAALSLNLGQLVCMDCRTIPICEAEICVYLAERQDEAWRNHVFSYGFYTLVEEGLTHAEAMNQLRGMREQDIHELVYQKGVNLAKTPAWERRGVMVYRKGSQVTSDWDLPQFRSEEGRRLLANIIWGLGGPGNDQ
ncbi:MAG: tRNAHis guanylyltransferase [Methanosaeta sp. PtaB.Bin018]|jgi:tRNA(His) 5'-end guanylyltransferase|nr:tRNA 5'-guanylyltransferase [Methanothrix sp.]OPX76207.1 MAG: tRNAHis guanylyltransferase [Methanosaeta sp. PtaB.Bin018]OPY43528.1 MAG: tRNAHis guanylyltransferase [Methanosaeta sp. PtaU1.Bin016]